MIIDRLIEKEFCSLSSLMSLKEVHESFESSKLNELPIVDDGFFKGVLLKSQLREIEKNSDSLSTLNNQFRSISVDQNEPMINVLKKLTKEGVSSLPVVDEDGMIKGLILSTHIWSEFASKSGLMGDGSWVVLTMKKNDYYLSEIAQIAESSGMIIVMHFVHFIHGVDLIDVHLKFNHENVNELVQAFQRYKYNVSDVIQPKKFEDDWDSKFDELMRFFST